MPAVTDANLISNTTVELRNLLINNLTDPVTRTGTSRLVMTSFPERDVQYPFVVVTVNNVTADAGPMSSTAKYFTIKADVEVLAKDMPGLDSLTDQCLDALRTEQYTASTGLRALELHNFSVVGMAFVPRQSGTQEPHRKIITVQFQHHTST